MLAITGLICSALLSAAASGEQTPQVPNIAFEKYTLPNGLDVILHEDHTTPIVDVNVWYHAGSKNERPGRTGFAHLFEHMMFQGSKHSDKNYIGPIQTAGGKLNGSTASDRTNYWETVPSNYLELALWMESDRMGFLLPAMTQKKLDNQRDVVKNERRQSYENRPYGLVYETMLAALYPTEHPYSWPTIGAMTDLDLASREDIAEFFSQYYNPANASLCIAGDFDPAQAKLLVAKYFGALPGGPKVERLKRWVPELTAEKRIRMTDRVGLARLYISWHSVPEFAEDDAELEVLAHVLAGNKTSRLYRTMVHQKQIAQEVQAMQDGSEIAGLFMLVLTARPGHTLAELEAAALEEIKRIQNEPPTAEEVARTVNFLESHFIRSLEPIGEFGGRADQLNRYNVLAGDPGYLAKDFQRFLRVDPQAVTRVAKKYLGPGRVVVEVVPGRKLSFTPDVLAEAAAAREKLAQRGHKPPAPTADATSKGEQAYKPGSVASIYDFDRSIMPKPAAEPKFSLPPIRRARLKNGMEVMLVEKHQLPLVNIHLVFPVGRWQDPANKPGLCNMMTALWDEGTERRSSEEIATQLAGIGASMSIGADWDSTSARLFTLKRQLGKALDIYADVLRHPAFPEAELERQRAAALAHLPQIRNEPVALAGMAAHQLLYGPEHPYGRPQFGSIKTLRALTRADIEQFYRETIRPQDACLIAVGDITLDELTGELERVLGGWRSQQEQPAKVNPPALPAAKPARLVLVDKPGAAQSVVYVSLPGARRTSPDYYRLLLTNAIFGGQFSSRLNVNLREQKGYTYGARTTFDWRVHEIGPFNAMASVQTAVTAPALAEFLKEFDGMVGGRPVTGDELQFCRRYLTRGYPAMFETTTQLAAQLESLFAYHLPDDYFNTFVPELSAVTADQVLDTAKKYLKVGELTIVVVGDRKKIEAGLRDLPVGKDMAIFQFDNDFRLTPAK